MYLGLLGVDAAESLLFFGDLVGVLGASMELVNFVTNGDSTPDLERNGDSSFSALTVSFPLPAGRVSEARSSATRSLLSGEPTMGAFCLLEGDEVGVWTLFRGLEAGDLTTNSRRSCRSFSAILGWRGIF